MSTKTDASPALHGSSHPNAKEDSSGGGTTALPLTFSWGVPHEQMAALRHLHDVSFPIRYDHKYYKWFHLPTTFTLMAYTTEEGWERLLQGPVSERQTLMKKCFPVPVPPVAAAPAGRRSSTSQRDQQQGTSRRRMEAEAIRRQREREEDEGSYVDEDEGIMRKPKKPAKTAPSPSKTGRGRKRPREEGEVVEEESSSQPPAVSTSTTTTTDTLSPHPTPSLHMTEEEKLAHAIRVFDKAAAAAAGTGSESFSPYLPSQDSAEGGRPSVSPSRRSLTPRKRFAFTQAEDDAIMAGVQEHSYVQGPSSFRLIYAKYVNVWEKGRTFVHLYDHWRSVLRPRTTSTL